MLNYKNFINEKVADIVANRVTFDGKPAMGFSEELSYQILFKCRKDGYEINPVLSEMINDGIEVIKEEYKGVQTQNYTDYVLSLINKHLPLITDNLKPLIQVLDKKGRKINEKTNWSVILTNTTMHRYLMTMYNYKQFISKEIDINKYLRFLVDYQNDLFFPKGVLFVPVLRILQRTMNKGVKNEAAAMYFLNQLQKGAFWIDDFRKANVNFKPLLMQGEILKPDSTFEDSKGTDLKKRIKYRTGVKDYTIQVKPLVAYDRIKNVITTNGRLYPYHTDFYIIVKKKWNDNTYYVIRNVDVKVEDTRLTVPDENLLIISDADNKFNKKKRYS